HWLLLFSLPPVSGVFFEFRQGAARAQAVDALRVKSQVTEDLFGVLAKAGPTPGRDLGDTVHLNRAADRRADLAAGAFERNDDVVCPQLRIVDHLLRSAHGAERDVYTAEDLVPVRHR